MKKRIALLLAALMLLTTPVFAEETNTETTAETETNVATDAAETEVEITAETGVVEAVAMSYEGDWMYIAGPQSLSFEIYLPTGWTDAAAADDETDAENADVTEESVYYTVYSDDGVKSITIAYNDLGEEKDADALLQELTETYADAAVVSINGRDFVRYTDSETDCVVLMLPEATGAYTFSFAPASDEELSAIIDEMINSITVYEVTEYAETEATE